MSKLLETNAREQTVKVKMLESKLLESNLRGQIVIVKKLLQINIHD